MKLFGKKNTEKEALSPTDVLASSVIIDTLKEYNEVLRKRLNASAPMSMERLEVHFKVQALEEIANLIGTNIAKAGFGKPTEDLK